MSEPTSHERRQTARFRVNAFVRIEGEQTFYLETRDISLGGVFLICRNKDLLLPQGSQVSLEIYAFERFVRCKGEVVRVVTPDSQIFKRQPSGIGVRFLEMDDENRALLEALMDHLRESERSISQEGGT